MDSGKILVAEHDGVHSIKLVGDVRVTLCCEFDEYIQHILAKPDYVNCLIDLTEAENIDSTTLGLMAKVAVRSAQSNQPKPTILAPSESMQRLLNSMSFDKVFDMRLDLPSTDAELAELCHRPCDESLVRCKVIEAHRVLIGISDENEAEFSALIDALENEQQAAH